MADTKVDSSDGPKIETKANLPTFDVPELEKDEEELFRMRAKLYRWAGEEDPPQWKERGTGDVKLLQHKSTSRIRLVMRRDKTFKVCANHYVDPDMTLKPHGGSDRAWVWNTFADFADGDEEAQKQLLAIRFLNEQNANKFKDKFVECQEIISKATSGEDECVGEIKSVDIINQGIDKLTVKEDTSKDDKTDKDQASNDKVASPEKEECNNNSDKATDDVKQDNSEGGKSDKNLKSSPTIKSEEISNNAIVEEDEPEK